MRLTKLEARRLHRRLDFDLEIAPVTLLVGLNESGKSTALGLPRLVLNGPAGASWPVVGLSPDYHFFAGADFDDGTTVIRSFGVPEGHQLLVDSTEHGGIRNAQTKILQRLGQSATFELEELTTLTPGKQLAWLETEVLDGSWPVDAIVPKVDALLAKRATKLPELLALPKLQWPRPGVTDGRAALADLRAFVAQADHEQDALARRLKAVVDQDHVDARGGLPAGSVAEWQGRLSAIQEELLKARERRGELAGKDAARRELEAQRTNLSIERERLSSENFGNPEMALKLRGAEASDRYDEALQEQERLTAQITALLEAHTPLVEAEAKALETGAALGATEKSLSEMEAKLGELRDFVRDVRALVEQIGSRGLQLLPGLDAVRAHLDRWAPVADAKVREDLEHQLAEARKRFAGCRTMREASQRRIDGIRTELRGVDERRRRADAEIATVSAERTVLTNRANATRDRLAAIAPQLQELSESLAGLGDTDTTAVDAQIGALELEQKELRTKVNVLQDAVNEQAARAENQMRLTEARERREQIRSFQKEIEVLWRDLLTELLRPLAEPVNAVCRSVLGADWVATSESGFTWGLTRQGTDLGPGSASGNAVAMVALRLALVGSMGGWRHLVLDELERLQVARRRALLTCMVEHAETGRLDNFIGAVVAEQGDPLDWVPPGVHVIRLPGGVEK